MNRSHRQYETVRVPRSRAIGGWLAISFVVTFAALLILSALDVQLGQGYFFFRYSQLRSDRTIRALPMLLVAGVFCASIVLLAMRTRAMRWIGLGVFGAGLIGMGAWAWWAPPQPLSQNMFSMTSLSTDGAFWVESTQIKSLPRYLRHFPNRLRSSPDDMGGTRVLSNPPGATLFAYAIGRWFDSSPQRLRWLDRVVTREGKISSAEAPDIANPLRFGIALMGMWVLSGVAAYGLGRVFLSPAGAVVFAVIVTCNPCTIHFVPGKDPAQLLTINLMLWAWFAGWKRAGYGPLPSAIAGALLIIGSTFGLIHIWVALIALSATLWHDLRDGRDEVPPSAAREIGGTSSRPLRVKRLLVGNVTPAAIGACIVCAIAWFAIGWNIPQTLLSVSRRWSELQGTFQMNRSIWYVIGLPIFLLFISPGIWLLMGLSIRRPRLNLGTQLAICTIAVMAIIYVGFGVTYELPRLWVAFLPTLVLGLAMNWPMLRGGCGKFHAVHPRVSRALMLVVLTQVAFTAFHWTFLDARETEYRLLSHRFYH